MTIPTTNVGMSSIQTEFGGSNPISMSEYYRGGALVPSGTATSPVDGVPITAAPAGSAPIRIGMFRGVSAVTNINLTISSNTPNYNIFTAAGSPSGPANVTVTVNSGIIVYGTGSSTAMTTGTGWASGSTITLVNNGIISGYVGNGGASNAGPNNGFPGIAGGPAFTATIPTTINNTSGIIAGGGGGGGSGGFTVSGGTNAGGQGGSGAGGLTSVGSGSIGTSGVGGTGAGAGGQGGFITAAGSPRLGQNGGSSAAGNAGGGGGGAWGHPGGTGGTSAGTATGGAGAKGGSAYTGSSNITWSGTGIRYGTIDNGNTGVLFGSYVRTIANSNSATVQSGISFGITGGITVSADSFSTVGSQSGMWVWYQPLTAGIGSSYWIRATLQSGTTPNSINAGLGTWLQLSTARAWENSRTQATGVGSTTSTLLIEISTSATGTPVVGSGSYTITATRT